MQRVELTPLKKARFEKGLTQLTLVMKTRIPQSRLSLIENEYYAPTKDEAKRISKVLGMAIQDLWPNGGGKK